MRVDTTISSRSSRSPRRRTGLRRTAASLASLALILSACGGSDDDTSAEPTDSAATAPAADGGESTSEGALQQTGPITIDGTPLPSYDPDTDDSAVGMPAPVVSGEDFDGTARSIGGATGSPTMVAFLAHWCPHCNDEIPELLALEDAGSLPADLEVIGVSTAVAPDRENYPPSDWFVEKGWPWPTMTDDDMLSAINAFGASSFPFIVLLDADGNVLARRGGQASAADTLAWIDEALGNGSLG